jgi:hypothetical protein
MAKKRDTAPRGGGKPGVVNASKNSKKQFYTFLGGAAIAGLLAVAWVTGKKQESRVIALDPNLPPITSEGYVMGSPTAPLELIEFGDFECAGCAQFATLTEPDIRTQYVNTGKIRFRYIDYPLLSIHPNSLNASNAAACADEQGKFWEMHDLLYRNQHKRIARGIPGIDAGKFDECVTSRRMMPKVKAHLQMALDRQANGTPTFVYNNSIVEFPPPGGFSFDNIKAFLDRELAKKDSASATKKP